ncbi:MAG TPA: DUF6580 family putative transport protein [Gemmataceae bacterium]|nr:DUF6580 family putative transport protein [Gemmataceae bacterium]
MRRILKQSLVPLEVILAALYRLIPYAYRPPNMAPVGAMGIYGGARLPLWQALIMPLLVMFMSDLLLWKFFHTRSFDLFVYGSMIVYVLLGRLVRNSRSPRKIALVTIIGSVQFYVITNFGTWYQYEIYPHTLHGLLACFVAGLLFFPFTLGGDLLFTGVLVYVHDWVAKHVTDEEEIPEEVPAAEKAAGQTEPLPHTEKAPA